LSSERGEKNKGTFHGKKKRLGAFGASITRVKCSFPQEDRDQGFGNRYNSNNGRDGYGGIFEGEEREHSGYFRKEDPQSTKKRRQHTGEESREFRSQLIFKGTAFPHPDHLSN